jgi:hypothetical protein
MRRYKAATVGIWLGWTPQRCLPTVEIIVTLVVGCSISASCFFAPALLLTKVDRSCDGTGLVVDLHTRIDMYSNFKDMLYAQDFKDMVYVQ